MSSESAGRPAPKLSSEQFRQACGRFATGVAIASVMDSQGTPHGLTVSSFTSVSLDPPLILICVGHEVTSIDVFRKASHFAINILAEDQREISTRFARKARTASMAWSGAGENPARRCWPASWPKSSALSAAGSPPAITIS